MWRKVEHKVSMFLFHALLISLLNVFWFSWKYLTTDVGYLQSISQIFHQDKVPGVQSNVATVLALWYQVLCDEYDADPAVVTSLCEQKFHVIILQHLLHQIIKNYQSMLTILGVLIKFTCCR